MSAKAWRHVVQRLDGHEHIAFRECQRCGELVGHAGHHLPQRGHLLGLREVLLVGIALLRLPRSEEHTSELQSLMRISYAVFCLQKKQHTTTYKYKNY